MYVISTKKEYDFTKELLTDFISIVRERRKEHSIERANFLNTGFIEQIKECIQQLRMYRREKRKGR